MRIYLISRFWVNEDNERGYTPLFFVDSVEEAGKICKEAGDCEGLICDKLMTVPNMKFQEIKSFSVFEKETRVIEKGQKYTLITDEDEDDVDREIKTVTGVKNKYSPDGWVYFYKGDNQKKEYHSRVWFFLEYCERVELK